MTLQIPRTTVDGRSNKRFSLNFYAYPARGRRRALPSPALPSLCPGLWGGQCWGRFFVRCPSDRPAIFVLFIRDVPGRATKRRLLEGGFTQLASNPTLPPSLPPVPRLSELHQNCHMRRPATTQQQWLLPLLGQKIPKSGADHKLG